MLEAPGKIEPCFFEEHIPASLADLSVEIQREAANLGQGLLPDSAAELADQVGQFGRAVRVETLTEVCCLALDINRQVRQAGGDVLLEEAWLDPAGCF